MTYQNDIIDNEQMNDLPMENIDDRCCVNFMILTSAKIYFSIDLW